MNEKKQSKPSLTGTCPICRKHHVTRAPLARHYETAKHRLDAINQKYATINKRYSGAPEGDYYSSLTNVQRQEIINAKLIFSICKQNWDDYQLKQQTKEFNKKYLRVGKPNP